MLGDGIWFAPKRLARAREDGTLSDASIHRLIWTPCPTKAGDVVLFGSHLAHRSVRTTAGPRRAAYITYSPASEGSPSGVLRGEATRLPARSGTCGWADLSQWPLQHRQSDRWLTTIERSMAWRTFVIWCQALNRRLMLRPAQEDHRERCEQGGDEEEDEREDAPDLDGGHQTPP